MRKLSILLLALSPATLFSQAINNQGEELNICRVWDGTDVALVDGSGNQLVGDGSGAFNVIVDSGSLTCNAGTNLNTSLLLTTTAHDAAFGTAGTADAQVRSIQGIASMTPVAIESTAASDSMSCHGDVGILDQFDLTNSNPNACAIVDGNGDQITSFGGGTQYTEADTDASITGTAMMMEGAGDALVAAQGTAANGLEVDVTRVQGTVAVTQSGTWDEVGINDSGNVITVDGTVTVTDGAGALNVIVDSGAVTVSATNLDIRDIDAASDDIAVHGDVGIFDQFDLTNSNPNTVAIVDANGDQITSFGGGTQYTEDVAAPADPVGPTLMMTRDDQIGTVTEVEGEWSRVRGTSKGALWVAIADSAGDPITSFGGGTEYAQGTATTDTDALKMAGAVRRDTAAIATGVADGDRLVLSTDASGRLRVTSADVTQPVSGTVTVTDGSGALNVIVDSGAVTVSATNLDIRDLAAASDSVAVHGDVGIFYESDLANSNPIFAAIVDGSGDQITSFGGGTQYTEADTDASITGTALMMEGAADALVAAQGTAANGLEVDVTRVTGTVTVDGSGVTQPVSNAGLTELAGAIDTEMQVDVVTSALPTGASTLAEQQTQTTHLATIAGDTTDIEAAVEVIDNTIFVDEAAFTVATSSVQAVGGMAVAHGSNPDAAAAGGTVVGLYNRHRVQWVLGGTPGAITREASWADADNAQTGASIVTVSAGTLICVTQLLVTCSVENTVKVSVRVMFDTDGTFAARATTGVDGGLFDHRGIGPGGGAVRGDGSGLLGCGTDDQDLRYSGDDPVTGSCSITATYYTSPS